MLCCGIAIAFSDPAWMNAQQQSPLCWVAPGMVVGEVPDLPFTARLVHRTWKLAPDGTRTATEPVDNSVALVARDSSGRVVTRKHGPATNRAAVWNSKQGDWSETICDPVAGTETDLLFHDLASATKDPSDDNIEETFVEAEGKALEGPRRPDDHTTITFQYWHNHVKGRENFPKEMFEGLPAYRYRNTQTREVNSGHDVVNSDELFVQLAFTKWLRYPDLEKETRLTEIHRGEPMATLFDIPHGVQIIHMAPMP
jgi:hypothetical protein